jgi:hypothetical protein
MHEPIQTIALLRCVEALVNEHDYNPEEIGDFDGESLGKLIGEIRALACIPEDVQIVTLHETDDDDNVYEYVEVRVKVGDLLVAGDQLDPYDYDGRNSAHGFQDLVANVINDVNERATRVREALAAYKKG